VRLLGGYLLFLFGVASLVGPAFVLFGLAIGADVHITRPLLFPIGIFVTVGSFWGAKTLMTAGSRGDPHSP
jgi:hypothetical protein